MAYGSICRGLLSGRMAPDTRFQGDDLRRHDPKFQQPRYSQYLKAVSAFESLAARRHDRHVLELAVRWVMDQGAIALWGARHPGQLDQIEKVFGWSLDSRDFETIDTLIRDAVTDPVGPEFMAPPARE